MPVIAASALTSARPSQWPQPSSKAWALQWPSLLWWRRNQSRARPTARSVLLLPPPFSSSALRDSGERCSKVSRGVGMPTGIGESEALAPGAAASERGRTTRPAEGPRSEVGTSTDGRATALLCSSLERIGSILTIGAAPIPAAGTDTGASGAPIVPGDAARDSCAGPGVAAATRGSAASDDPPCEPAGLGSSDRWAGAACSFGRVIEGSEAPGTAGGELPVGIAATGKSTRPPEGATAALGSAGATSVPATVPAPLSWTASGATADGIAAFPDVGAVAPGTPAATRTP